MLIRIERGSSVPVSRQIDAQVRAQILAGTLPAETPLPSVRQLARELAVNVNTVVRVYERLAAEGLVEMRHGDGTYVLPLRRGTTAAQLAEHHQEFQQELDTLTRRGLMLGIGERELGRLFAESVKRVRQNGTAEETATPRQKKGAEGP